jgi:hypothetical protein
MASVITRFCLIYLSMGIAWVYCLRVPAHAWRLRLALLASISWGLFTEILAFGLAWFYQENCLLYNVCASVEFLLLIGVLYRFQPRWRYVLVLAAVGGCVTMAVAAILRDPTVFLLIEALLVLSVIMTVLLVAALWSLANTSPIALQKVPEFWLFMGLLVYFAGLVPYIGMVKFVFQENAALAEKLSFTMPMLCILRYLSTARACALQARSAGARPHA